MMEDFRGQEILGFQIKEFIGQGGMATVWLAENPNIEREVAIKVLDPLLARDGNLVERFRSEARVQSRLRHANIVSVENFSTEPLAMIMEYVPGRTMADVIGREVGPIPLLQALPYMTQILAAVGHAHGQEVIHRDLKPSNVLVSHDGEVKVMDFGIAKVTRGVRITRTGTTLGTAVYMSPEQIKGARDVDVRSDIYSLGITFYEMLAGRAPFEDEAGGDNDFMIKEAHVRKTPPDPRQFYPKIPQGAVDVIARALAKDPAERFQHAWQFADALEAVSLEIEEALVTTGPQRPVSSEAADPFAAAAVSAFPDPEAPTELLQTDFADTYLEEDDDLATQVVQREDYEPPTLVAPPREVVVAVAPTPVPEPLPARATPVPIKPVVPLPRAQPLQAERSSSSLVVLLALGGGIIVVLAVLAGLLWRSSATTASTPSAEAAEEAPEETAPRPSREETAPDKNARQVRVTSTPPGAGVMACGKATGARTPATIQIPSRERCEVVLRLSGHEHYRFPAAMVGAAIRLYAVLQKKPAPAPASPTPAPSALPRQAWRADVKRAMKAYRARQWPTAFAGLKQTASRLRGKNKKEVEKRADLVRRVGQNWLRGERETDANKRRTYYTAAKGYDALIPGSPHQRALRSLISKTKRQTLDDLIDGALSRKKRRPSPRPQASKPNFPETLTRSQIIHGMRGTKKPVQLCYDRFKVPGLASVRVTIMGTGRVQSARVRGVFAGTPTASCVRKAVMGGRFDRFNGSPVVITYPFILR